MVTFLPFTNHVSGTTVEAVAGNIDGGIGDGRRHTEGAKSTVMSWLGVMGAATWAVMVICTAALGVWELSATSGSAAGVTTTLSDASIAGAWFPWAKVTLISLAASEFVSPGILISTSSSASKPVTVIRAASIITGGPSAAARSLTTVVMSVPEVGVLAANTWPPPVSSSQMS